MPRTDTYPYSFGIEEEFFLVSPATRNLVAQVPRAFLRTCRDRYGDCVGHEMLQSQVEVASPILFDAQSSLDEMRRLRNGVAAIAAGAGLRLVASGTHPLGAWQDQAHTEKPRYVQLISDYQIVGRRNLVSGLHVHVAPPPDVDRVALMNRLMSWLPLFLALSTSSPFWNRQVTGLLSYRQAAYDEWPRTGIPDFFADEAEYRAFVDLLVRCESITDQGSLWWAIRPAREFPTLELRIADSCTAVEDSVALAALFRCLVRAHVREPSLGAQRTALTRRVIDENRWRAKRYGTEARFIDEAGAVQESCADALARVRALVAEDADALGCADALRRLDAIVAEGTSAHRQLAVYRAQRELGASRLEALREVVDWLIEATVPGGERAAVERAHRAAIPH